ncbi:MAG: dTMP kinase [Geobacter sp.]|nr:dTMP kinase [Geobacter sp.]
MQRFITFEGIEGCGKSTQLRLLSDRLEHQGFSVVTTREPGGSPIADQIRAILLDAGNRAMTPMAELLLYAAARAQHVEEVIAPALAVGKIVLCDRFTDATVAYQGFGRGLDMATILELNRLASRSIRPDISVLLDCPVETGLSRAKARIENAAGAREERFELEEMAFHEKVRRGYLELASREPERFIVVSGSRGVDETAAEIFDLVAPRLAGPR